MTETALNERIDEILESEASIVHQRKKDRSRQRRIREIQKSDRLLQIINYGGYAPHRGYINGGFDGQMLLHSGKHIKYPKNSKCQDGSNGKPAGESAAAAALRHKEISAGCPMIMSDILTKNLCSRLLHK